MIHGDLKYGKIDLDTIQTIEMNKLFIININQTNKWDNFLHISLEHLYIVNGREKEY